MEGKKNQPRAILVFGAPCSGKTTFCENFARRFKIAFYDLESLKTNYNLSRKLVLMLVEQLAKTNQTMIFEGGVKTERERNEMRHILRTAGYSVSIVWLQTDIVTIRNRLKNKYKTVNKAKEIYDTVIPSLEAPSDLEFPIILSGKHTFETQLKHILAGLA